MLKTALSRGPSASLGRIGGRGLSGRYGRRPVIWGSRPSQVGSVPHGAPSQRSGFGTAALAGVFLSLTPLELQFMVKKDEEKVEAEGAPIVETMDGPLLDLNDAAVKRMIKLAKKRGFVTYSELNAVLPSEEVSSDQIEDVYSMLSEMGITVSEGDNEDQEEEAQEPEAEEPEGGELVEAPRTTVVATKTSEPADRTDDPVRMYLREMGSVELLSREGEIAIAKRIEAGREAM